MGKICQSINYLGRLTIASNSCDRANANDIDRHSPHVDDKFDANSSWINVCSSIQVHVPCHSQILTKLWIYIPENFKPQTAKIEITDSAEPTLSERDLTNQILRTRTIAALISRQGQWLQIKFERSIAPDTKLSIAFNSISRNMLVRLPEYFVYGKSVNGQSSFIGRGYFERTERF
ncbi:hypothetical protein [Chamaesiphon minutus]|uniref:Uncharacterized protein n=1 Tax=Chamaesiphon minutus (strain ATCC 27169 / PCC 6605) TaxID=1173020 RepID=K9UQC6_CHAP6|nr:hypothetical protein [Chamaesiphon minutus]AFY96878.1 hypothetical protein Cha6605_6038 [Chamaesiphon minutus PCC 6605]